MTRQNKAMYRKTSALNVEADHAINSGQQSANRPKRKCAGKRLRSPGYLDPIEVIDSDLLSSLSSEDESDGDRSSKRTKRERRSSSTHSLTPITPISTLFPHPELDQHESSPSLQIVKSSSNQDRAGGEPSKYCLNLTVNIPLRFRGPLILSINPSGGPDACQVSTMGDANVNDSLKGLFQNSVARDNQSTSKSTWGFCAMPPEIRNKVYGLLFTSETAFNFASPVNFGHSAAFLRTCKQVHSEGTSILYGKNVFAFQRCSRSRAQVWSPVQEEVGFKDILRFLKAIETKNLARIRTMTIIFEDAAPNLTPTMSHEERRYINDKELMESLRIIGHSSKLESLTMSFYGRRTLYAYDVRVVDLLKQIKADQVLVSHCRPWLCGANSKIDWRLEDELIRTMTRKKKLFPRSTSDPTTRDTDTRRNSGHGSQCLSETSTVF